MSKPEIPMVLAYWERVGGTLVKEFLLAKGDAPSGPRPTDAIIVLGQERVQLASRQMS